MHGDSKGPVIDYGEEGCCYNSTKQGQVQVNPYPYTQKKGGVGGGGRESYSLKGRFHVSI